MWSENLIFGLTPKFQADLFRDWPIKIQAIRKKSTKKTAENLAFSQKGPRNFFETSSWVFTSNPFFQHIKHIGTFFHLKFVLDRCGKIIYVFWRKSYKHIEKKGLDPLIRWMALNPNWPLGVSQKSIWHKLLPFGASGHFRSFLTLFCTWTLLVGFTILGDLCQFMHLWHSEHLRAIWALLGTFWDTLSFTWSASISGHNLGGNHL